MLTVILDFLLVLAAGLSATCGVVLGLVVVDSVMEWLGENPLVLIGFILGGLFTVFWMLHPNRGLQ